MEAGDDSRMKVGGGRGSKAVLSGRSRVVKTTLYGCLRNSVVQV